MHHSLPLGAGKGEGRELLNIRPQHLLLIKTNRIQSIAVGVILLSVLGWGYFRVSNFPGPAVDLFSPSIQHT